MLELKVKVDIYMYCKCDDILITEPGKDVDECTTCKREGYIAY
jgi:hypothetical protein